MRNFIEALKRLYKQGDIPQEKIVELCINKKITDDEKLYILK